jgi:DNA repair protein RecN (Recombination protein N)
MLINLQIKNFLLIDEIELDFSPGLTVITGETGSGKSNSIDALMLVFGLKAGADLIRIGQVQASFTATFIVNNQQILVWLQQHDFVDNDEEKIICRRVLDKSGRSKAYINGIPVTLGVMKELGAMLLDIHTQHASIALLKPENQRQLLDEYAGISNQVSKLQKLFNHLNQLEDKLTFARKTQQDNLQKQEFLRLKINELEELDLGAEEWQELLLRQKQLANASYLLQELECILNLLNGDAPSLNIIAANILNHVHKISNLVATSGVLELLNSIEAEIGEVVHAINSLVNKIDQDPEQLLLVDSRIDEIYTAARKYRIQPQDILPQLEIWKQELCALEYEHDLNNIVAAVLEVKQNYLTMAEAISKARQVAAQELSGKVTKLLSQLSINGEFKVALSPVVNWSSWGLDTIQYLVNFNPGLPLQSLQKVISGGELSRLALALYVTLSINNPPELIVFDEIDVGISGGIAEVVGKLLRELGKSKQVICITHQPQTACCGLWHLQTSKMAQGVTISSQIKYISGAERILEIARMLGGINITATTQRHAREMLGGQDN